MCARFLRVTTDESLTKTIKLADYGRLHFGEHWAAEHLSFVCVSQNTAIKVPLFKPPLTRARQTTHTTHACSTLVSRLARAFALCDYRYPPPRRPATTRCGSSAGRAQSVDRETLPGAPIPLSLEISISLAPGVNSNQLDSALVFVWFLKVSQVRSVC